MKLLDDPKILSSKQFGFRKNFSTTHVIISLIGNIQKSTDDKKIACGSFIDPEKAFDTVDYNLLLNKLSHYSIRGIANSCFKSYLSNRTQYVLTNCFNANHKLMKYDFPQGSTLQPLFFLIFINDVNAI